MLIFSAIAALVCLGAAALVTRPLWSRRDDAPDYSARDVEVYKDQLKELQSDVERGVLSPQDAEPSRIEISRRLLAADAVAERTVGDAPNRVNTIAIIAVAIATIGGSAALYSVLGTPGLQDFPLATRSDLPVRLTQAEAEAEVDALVKAEASEPTGQDAVLLEQLQQVLAERPDDAQGYRLLASTMARFGKFAEAKTAQARVLEIEGDAATPADLSAMAEYLIFAARGYVSPQADDILARTLQVDLGNRRARYYSGLSMAQQGRAQLAMDIWGRLYGDGDPNEPWKPIVLEQATALADSTGLPLPETMTQPPMRGPSAEDMQAAQDMTPEERMDMIRGMVDGLSSRLAEDGGPPQDWARLISSLGVLGETDRAAAIYNEALGVFSADPDALGLITRAGEMAGVAQ